MSNYRVAVIGRTGKGNYGHGLDTVWLKCDRAEIVAVADENETGRAAAAKRLGAKNAYADYRADARRRRSRRSSASPTAGSTATATWSSPAPSRGQHLPGKAGRRRRLQQADEMVAACDKHHVKVRHRPPDALQPARARSSRS